MTVTFKNAATSVLTVTAAALVAVPLLFGSAHASGRGGASETGACGSCGEPETPSTPSTPSESEQDVCNYGVDKVGQNGLFAIGKGAGLNASDYIISSRRNYKVGYKRNNDILRSTSNEHHYCASRYGKVIGTYGQVGWNGTKSSVKTNTKKTRSIKKFGKPVRAGVSTKRKYVAKKIVKQVAKRIVNTTMATVNACLATPALKTMHKLFKKKTPNNVVVRNTLRDASKYNFTSAQVSQMKDCSSVGISRKDNKLCVVSDLKTAVAFANGAACPSTTRPILGDTTTKTPTVADGTTRPILGSPAKVKKSAEVKVKAKTAAACTVAVASENMVATYIKDGVSAQFTIQAGDIQSVTCGNTTLTPIAAGIDTVAELQALTGKDLVQAQDISPVAAQASGSFCPTQSAVAKMCQAYSPK